MSPAWSRRSRRFFRASVRMWLTSASVLRNVAVRRPGTRELIGRRQEVTVLFVRNRRAKINRVSVTRMSPILFHEYVTFQSSHHESAQVGVSRMVLDIATADSTTTRRSNEPRRVNVATIAACVDDTFSRWNIRVSEQYHCFRRRYFKQVARRRHALRVSATLSQIYRSSYHGI